MGGLINSFLGGAAPGVAQMGTQLAAYGMSKSLQEEELKAKQEMESRIAERTVTATKQAQGFTADEANKQRTFTEGEANKQRDFLSGQEDQRLSHQLKKEKNDEVRVRVSALQDAVKAEQESIKQDRFDMQSGNYSAEQMATVQKDIETRAAGVAAKVKTLTDYANTGSFMPVATKPKQEGFDPNKYTVGGGTEKPGTGIIGRQTAEPARPDLIVPPAPKYPNTKEGAMQAVAEESAKDKAKKDMEAARKAVEQYTKKAARGIGDPGLAKHALGIEEKYPGTLSQYEKEQAIKLTREK
mgnify:CR=1 FL=1